MADETLFSLLMGTIIFVGFGSFLAAMMWGVFLNSELGQAYSQHREEKLRKKLERQLGLVSIFDASLKDRLKRLEYEIQDLKNNINDKKKSKKSISQ